jgi:hypothetical protein
MCDGSTLRDQSSVRCFWRNKENKGAEFLKKNFAGRPVDCLDRAARG